MNEPSACGLAVPWAISWLAAGNGRHQKHQSHHGEPHLADDVPLDLRPVDRRAGVGGRIAVKSDLAVELQAGLGRIERHVELRPLVLFDRNAGAPGGWPSTRIDIWPISRSRGAVKLPLKLP